MHICCAYMNNEHVCSSFWSVENAGLRIHTSTKICVTVWKFRKLKVSGNDLILAYFASNLLFLFLRLMIMLIKLRVLVNKKKFPEKKFDFNFLNLEISQQDVHVHVELKQYGMDKCHFITTWEVQVNQRSGIRIFAF